MRIILQRLQILELTQKEYKITIYETCKKIKNEIKGEQGNKNSQNDQADLKKNQVELLEVKI